MKKLFPGYYRLTDQERSVLWKESIFVLDTNILLSLYSYPKKLRDDWINILKKLSDEQRLWIPFQVALEYQKNLTSSINKELDKYSNVEKTLVSIRKTLSTCLGKMGLEKQPYSLKRDSLMSEFDDFSEEFRTKMEQLALERLDVSMYSELEDKYGALREEIDQLAEDNVGPPPDSQQWLDQIHEEGEKRRKLSIPPGYKDKGKDCVYRYRGLEIQQKYGDLILWRQIIEYAKTQEKLKYIIFITNENDNDWWQKKDSNVIGPRIELVEEISSEAGICLFHMYQADRFMKRATEHLEIQVSDESIAQMEDIVEATKEEADLQVEKIVLNEVQRLNSHPVEANIRAQNAPRQTPLSKYITAQQRLEQALAPGAVLSAIAAEQRLEQALAPGVLSAIEAQQELLPAEPPDSSDTCLEEDDDSDLTKDNE